MNKPVIVLKALFAGLEIELGGVKVFLGTDKMGRRILTHTMKNAETSAPVLIGVPCPLGRFIGMCEILSDEDIAIIGANLTLNEIKHKGADRQPKEEEDE